MLMIDYKVTGWWYWLVTAILLSIGLSGYPDAFILTMNLMLWQMLHFAIADRSVTSFAVQVRFWYLVMIMAFLPESFQFLYWLPVIGTWAQVLFGYCAMARILSLFPRNRTKPLSIELVTRTFFSPPIRGNILKKSPAI